MTEVNERYQRGKIYCLRSHQTDLVYIGSTVQSLSKRIGGHRDKYKGWLKGTSNYVTSFEIIKYDDHYIELVENYPCKTKAELERCEGQIMRDTENCCNKVIVGRTGVEYRQDNKEKIAEYYQKNKEKFAEYAQKNKERIAKRQAEYRAKNKEKITERMVDYHVQWYAKNKDKIAEKRKEKVTCECGSEVIRNGLPRHRKSKKHQKWVEQNSE